MLYFSYSIELNGGEYEKTDFAGILLFSAAAFADTVILTDGKSIPTGSCEVESGSKIICQSEDGSRSINLPLKAIKEIRSAKGVQTRADLMKKASELEGEAVFQKDEKKGGGSVSVTLQKFNGLTQGMTYGEVKRILGPGTEVNRFEAGEKLVTFQWDGTEGGAMRATFTGGEKDDDEALTLKAKAQMQLK
ncbi:MAG: hypothetical protein HC887_11070 [Desulfobacteraceae bacterium]|nr:hypothetical protein [Desulfobacteraceae bacterium]